MHPNALLSSPPALSMRGLQLGLGWTSGIDYAGHAHRGAVLAGCPQFCGGTKNWVSHFSWDFSKTYAKRKDSDDATAPQDSGSAQQTQCETKGDEMESTSVTLAGLAVNSAKASQSSCSCNMPRKSASNARAPSSDKLSPSKSSSLFLPNGSKLNLTSRFAPTPKHAWDTDKNDKHKRRRNCFVASPCLRSRQCLWEWQDPEKNAKLLGMHSSILVQFESSSHGDAAETKEVSMLPCSNCWTLNIQSHAWGIIATCTYLKSTSCELLEPFTKTAK